MIIWIHGHFAGVSKYKYLFSGATCVFCREFFNYLLMKEGVVIVEINKWLARFLEPVAEEALLSSFLVCFDFQLIFPNFVHVLDSFLSRAFLTPFPEKSTCSLLPRLGSSNHQVVGVRRDLENSISYVDVTLILQGTADRTHEIT